MHNINTCILLVAVMALNISCADRPEVINRNYNELHRPQFHFSPAEKWTNDPNGLVYYEGEYHLFYQYYPDSTVWGPMHWGHAVSTDLIQWEHLPIALYPDSLGYIFSGSAVIDWNNTSGLGTASSPPMVAIYTYHDPVGAKAGRLDYQTQGIAYSTDKGRTWVKYEGNPVIANPGIPDFRDPKVSWHPAFDKWIMTLAVKDHVSFYSSDDLITWQFESDFGKELGAHGGVWECPDLFKMKVDDTREEKYVLLVSINPGGPNGGSATQYFVGQFDGNTFQPDPAFLPQVTGTDSGGQARAVWIDHGKDNYAGVTFSDAPDGRHIFIGWMSNWQYANVVPTETWRNAMTLPRDLHLTKHNNSYILRSQPVPELVMLRKDTTISVINSREDLIPFGPDGLEADITFSEITDDCGVTLSNGKENITIGIDYSNGRLFVDRTNSGMSEFSSHFQGIHYAGIADLTKPIKMHLFIDRSSLEVFLNDGETVMTEIFFPTANYDLLNVYAENERIKIQGKGHHLHSTWAQNNE